MQYQKSWYHKHFTSNFKANKRHCNTAILLTAAYIGCVWYNRSQTKCIEIQVYKTRILKQHIFLQMILK